MKLSDYVVIIRRNIVSIISISLVAATMGYFIASSISPAYRSTVNLMINNQATAPQLSISPALSLSKDNSFVQSQIHLIRSRVVAELVIDSLNLRDHQDFRPKKKGFSALLKDTFKLSQMSHSGDEATEVSRGEIPLYVQEFSKRLTVSSDRGGSMISISFDSSEASMAAKIANEIVVAYRKTLNDVRTDSLKNTMGWLSLRLEEVRQQLVESEAKLRSYQENENVIDSSEEKKIRTNKLGGITSTIVKARARRADAEAVYNQIKQLLHTSGKDEAVAILNSRRVNELTVREEQILFEVKQAEKRYGEKHPKMNALRNRYQEAQKQTRQEIDNAIRRVQKERDLAIANEREANKLYAEIQREMSSARGKQFNLAKLEMEVATNREMYDLLRTRMKEANLGKIDGASSIRVLDPAAVPSYPHKPNKFQIVIFSMLLGAFLSLSIAIYRDLNDPTFKTGEELQEKLKSPLLGVVPAMSNKFQKNHVLERLALSSPRTVMTESFNNLRTNMLLNDGGEDVRVVLVSSAIASEGKTTVSSNLAISLAALGPTIIVEADTRKPRLGALYKQSPEGGLLEYVTRKSTLKSSVIKDNDVPGLYVMPVKTMPANPLEFLSGQAFEEALNRLKNKFKYVVIDSPPILPLSDSVVLSRLSDGVVLVVGAEKTHKKAVLGAVDRLNHVNAKLIGTVLSQANLKTIGSYSDQYYYGYQNYEKSATGNS